MVNKLERLTIATNYTLREPKHSAYATETGRRAKERIDAWKGSFQVKKSSHAMEKVAHNAAEHRDLYMQLHYAQ